jgi:hypothetical protein
MLLKFPQNINLAFSLLKVAGTFLQNFNCILAKLWRRDICVKVTESIET